MTEQAVELRDVVMRFGNVEAVKGISLEVGLGEFVAFIGPSGCGKTTTLRLMAGLEKPTSGDIFIRGKRVNDVKPWQRDTPLVWQHFALFPHLNVAKNVEFGLRMRTKLSKAERGEKVSRALGMVGIPELTSREIGQLSGGQKQRVGLARALVADPEVLLLDEPLGSLDAHLKVRMQAELRQLQQELGITFVYVTHNQSEALSMADRVVVMNAGDIRQVGSPREVYREPRNRFVAEFVGTNNIFEGTVTEVGSDRVAVETSTGRYAVAAGGRRPSVGEPVTFVICADRVSTEAEGALEENRVSGTLRGQEFVGSVVTLFLELADGSEFRIQMQEHQLAKIATKLGERMDASWTTSAAFLLAES